MWQNSGWVTSGGDMTNREKGTDRPLPDRQSQPRRLRIDAERAAELVNRVRGDREEPFGPLSLVRAVIRPKRPEPG